MGLAGTSGCDEVDDEDQRLVRADHAASAVLAVGQVRRDGELAATAHLHAGDALIPARDHMARAEREGERGAAIQLASNCLPVANDTPT